MNNYSEEEYKIFSRLFILKEFSEENLKKLSNIKIGIVGMGGIGCPLIPEFTKYWPIFSKLWN